MASAICSDGRVLYRRRRGRSDRRVKGWASERRGKRRREIWIVKRCRGLDGNAVDRPVTLAPSFPRRQPARVSSRSPGSTNSASLGTVPRSCGTTLRRIHFALHAGSSSFYALTKVGNSAVARPGLDSLPCSDPSSLDFYILLYEPRNKHSGKTRCRDCCLANLAL